jgi:hypothetical protein
VKKRNFVVVTFLCLTILAAVSFAASNPKTTGDADWVNSPTSYNQQANTIFHAIATTRTGLGAKGALLYSDPKITYTMDVQFLRVSGNTAWFAGQVTSASDPGVGGCCKVGNWIFWKVQDNGEPGVGVDKIWGEDLTVSEGITDSIAAALKVASMATPESDPFTINGGNIQVHQNNRPVGHRRPCE